jgi:hypothetical protein
LENIAGPDEISERFAIEGDSDTRLDECEHKEFNADDSLNVAYGQSSLVLEGR